MKNLIHKFLLWLKDHFSFLFVVLFRLHVGETKKRIQPKDIDGSNPDFEEVKTEKGD